MDRITSKAHLILSLDSFCSPHRYNWLGGYGVFVKGVVVAATLTTLTVGGVVALGVLAHLVT
jgi:hypothetical protein